MKHHIVVPPENIRIDWFSDFRFDVTLSRRRPWRHFTQKVLLPGEWTRSVCRRLGSWTTKQLLYGAGLHLMVTSMKQYRRNGRP